jgi:hypothetical protein
MICVMTTSFFRFSRAVVGLVLATAIALPAAPADLHAAPVPAPKVTGPVRAAAPGDPGRDYPFHAAAVDLNARGYVEEEFFIEGAANRYATAPLASATVVDGNHPYKTRLVVRRPVAASRFNGTVIVEWNNVTAGRDLDIDWFQTHEHLMRSGYAWVGVSAQRIGVEALKVWNANRYGSLDVSHGGTVTSDELSYDVFSQAGQAIRTPGAVNVMGGFKVERTIATGHSQSAGRLGIYVNSVHPLAKVFDAVVLHGGGGRVRTDLDIPVWKLLAETDVQNQAVNRQPDTNRFRTWEVAGNSHVDVKFTSYSRLLAARDGNPTAPGFSPLGGRGGRSATSGAAPTGVGRSSGLAAPGETGAAFRPRASAGTTSNPGGCDRPPYSHIPFHYVFNAALDHLVRWVKDGTLPPAAPPIDLTAVGPPAVMARDEAGNALGGIRLSQHAVPTAVNTGVNSGPGFCFLNGSHEPFDAATLARLYPTHDSYVAKVRESAQKNLKAGYILKADADATIADAERSGIGER